MYITVNKSSLPKFTCDYAMHWPLISYKIYGTTRLAWLLWKLNDVDLAGSLKKKYPGDTVLYLPSQYVDGIVSDINQFEES